MKNLDEVIFLFLNGLNTEWLDPIMKAISSFWIWYPIAALIIFLSIKYFKRGFWVPIVFAIICFAITDQGSTLVKKSTKRYRPSHNVELYEKVHIVDDYRGGQYGFFSGHAANSFGLAVISLLFFRKKWFTITVIIWAALVSYSRIYIGVHFPSDIFVGALFGSLVAFGVYYLHKRISCCRVE